jgi:BASS family bile acid:Na+ symporter
MLARLTNLFPLWALAGTAFAFFFPAALVPMKPAIVPLLGVVMFGMGIGLTAGNFLDVLRRPLPVALGVGLQFLVMPLLGWLLAVLAGLPPMLVAGVVLLGSCPGGTASNVICYLARGDVALSITLTAVSTLLAVVATPLLTLLYAGQTVPVPAIDMLFSILKVILLPVAAGVFLNHLFHRQLAPLRSGFPLLSVAAIVFIIAIIVALNRDQLASLAPVVAVARRGQSPSRSACRIPAWPWRWPSSIFQ